MSGESRVKSPNPDEARSARTDSVKLGLVAAPEIPRKIAEKIAPELPDLLSRRVDDRLSWDISVVVDSLTGTDRESPEILDVCLVSSYSIHPTSE
jgi:hypothetical protein